MRSISTFPSPRPSPPSFAAVSSFVRRVLVRSPSSPPSFAVSSVLCSRLLVRCLLFPIASTLERLMREKRRWCWLCWKGLSKFVPIMGVCFIKWIIESYSKPTKSVLSLGKHLCSVKSVASERRQSSFNSVVLCQTSIGNATSEVF